MNELDGFVPVALLLAVLVVAVRVLRLWFGNYRFRCGGGSLRFEVAAPARSSTFA